MDQIYREFPLRAGRVVVRGSKAQRDKTTVLRADYALFYKADIPIATIEAKDNQHDTRVTALRRLCADLRHRLAERGAVQARLAEALVQAVV